MKDFLLHHCSGICIAILAVLEIIVLFLPGGDVGTVRLSAAGRIYRRHRQHQSQFSASVPEAQA